MLALRPYQNDAIARIRESLLKHGRTLYRLPTGGGKTAIFGYIAAGYARAGQSALIIVPRRLLVAQTLARLQEDWGVTAGVICAGYDEQPMLKIQIASVQTLAARLKRLTGYLGGVSLAIVDEAHHSTADTTLRVLGATRGRILGVTATPQRLDGKALDPPFKDIVIGTGEKELIAAGYLADYRIFMPKGMHDPNWGNMRSSEITAGERKKAERNIYRHGDAVDVYRRWAAGKRAIAFGYSVADSIAIADRFCGAGIPAAAVHGEMGSEEVAATIAKYEAGEILVLTCCDLINEGFDVQETACVIQMAKTQSLTRYMQNNGRALRPKADGGAAVIIDMVGNALTHGLPCDEREWTLAAKERKGGKREEQVKTCLHCFAVSSASAAKCRMCGRAFPPPKKRPGMREDLGEAVGEMTKEQVRELRAKRQKARAKLIGRARTLDQLLEVERQLGYKSGWARTIHHARQARFRSMGA